MLNRVIKPMRTLKIIGCGVGLLFSVTPLMAHHAFSAEFDSNQPVALRGTVSRVDWVNPHAWVYMDVKGDDGQVTNWAFELGAPNALFRRGWRKDSVAAGTEIAVTGFRAKSGKPIANGRTIKLPDGRELFAGSEGTGAPPDTAEPK